MLPKGESAGKSALGHLRRVERNLPVGAVLVLLLAATSLSPSGKPRGAEAPSPVAATKSREAIAYVSANGSDSNDGLSWGTAKATIAAAIAALPNCTAKGIKGRKLTAVCGDILLGAGTFAMSSGLTITSPFVSIRGQSPVATQIHYMGSGCAINVDIGSHVGDDEYQPGVFSNFSIDGSGNTNSNACGFESQYLSNVTLRNVSISNFTKSGDSCLFSYAGPGTSTSFNERNNLGPAWLGNCTTGWLIKTPTTPSAQETLGYGNTNLYINVQAGQTGIASVGTARTQLLMTYENFHIIINISTTNRTTCADFKYSTWTSDLGMWRCDGSAGTEFSIDAHSTIRLGGAISIARNNNIAPGGILDLTSVSTDKGNGPLVLWHETSAGQEYSAIQPSAVGSFFNYMPASNGTLALKGANGVSAGVIKLSSGSGSRRFSTAYRTAPVCTATDTTRAAPVKVSSNTTAVMVTGTASDVVAWICTSAAN